MFLKCITGLAGPPADLAGTSPVPPSDHLRQKKQNRPVCSVWNSCPCEMSLLIYLQFKLQEEKAQQVLEQSCLCTYNSRQSSNQHQKRLCCSKSRWLSGTETHKETQGLLVLSECVETVPPYWHCTAQYCFDSSLIPVLIRTPVTPQLTQTNTKHPLWSYIV